MSSEYILEQFTKHRVFRSHSYFGKYVISRTCSKEIKLIMIKLLNVFNVSLVATDRQKV